MKKDFFLHVWKYMFTKRKENFTKVEDNISESALFLLEKSDYNR